MVTLAEKNKDYVNAARIIGMISTIFGAVVMAAVCVVSMVAAVLVLRQHR